MKENLFGKGKVAFQLFCLLLFRWITINCQLNLYNTDRTIQGNSLQFDCLNYHIRHEKWAYHDLLNVIDEVIPYCVRPANNSDKQIEAFINPLSQKLTFQGLSLTKITLKQLLLWSIPIDVVHRYQLYLDEPNISLNEHIYNCTEPWFGLYCQYSFKFGESMKFNQIVEAAFRGRKAYAESPDIMVQMPCYVLLECHRYGKVWCLDWREVCDGNIDCFDEGLDEKFCFDMEINECKENERRCYNGLCISRDLWEEDEDDMDCLDRSDRRVAGSYMKLCFQDPTFRCEEHSCKPGVETFPCGDGQCVMKFGKCNNGRHLLLVELMLVKGNLTNECWTAMVCLTRIFNPGNGSLCKTLLMNNSTYEFLEHCDSFFQFPTIPILPNDIRFYYEKTHLRRTLNGFLLPSYVCYNPELCGSIMPQIVHENLTCLNDHESLVEPDTNGNPWLLMILTIENYFHHCLTRDIFVDITKYSGHPSLYKCQNSSKFISKHRIIDGKIDCIGKDDEYYENSCHLNHSYRVKCQNENKCWSPLLTINRCLFNREQSQKEITFQRLCDGIEEHFEDDNGNQFNDESGCEEWCDNMYTRCDGDWSCSDGRDENNCTRTKCDSGTYACISPLNYTVICLSSKQVNNKIIDCLGAADEQKYCRISYPTRPYRFQCDYEDEPLCLSSSQLCDENKDCSGGDDENFCQKYSSFSCKQDARRNRTEIEELLCGLSEAKNDKIQYFSVHTSSNYPLLQNNIDNEIIHWSTEQHHIKNVNESRVENILWPWDCNRGLAVWTWTENNTYNITCMCPPSYYGHLCQYQNQRISLTLRMSSSDWHATYAVVIMLIDDDDERQNIEAYDQFVYTTKQSCSIKLKRYLLFSTRPKNLSKNYSVRIATFDKNNMKYVGSWYFPVPFLFMPVNPLAVSLVLSNYPIHISSNCPITCNNGSCVKYFNEEKYFCRCQSGWSGIYCHIPVNCETCLFKSICVGSTNNQSICVCPLNKFGPQCSSTTTCPPNACQNNGQCVPADLSIPGSDYTCICPDQFFGTNCQYSKFKLDVSLINIDIPSYLVAYFFTLSNTSQPIDTMLLRKLTLFQRAVTFYISVPFHLLIVQALDTFYLAALQQSPRSYISTLIKPAQQCIPSYQLFNSTVLNMSLYQRTVLYYDLCQSQANVNVTCFIDEFNLCLCTKERHANCMKFNYNRSFKCVPDNHCINGGECLQDHPICPSTKICLCSSCFFGSTCQFYAKGLGSTLDEILGYEIQRNTILTKQPIAVQVSAAITMLIFVIGIIDSIASIMTFSRKKSQEVGSGIYLLTSSIVSLCIIILFTLKFWLLFLSHQDYFGHRVKQNILAINCMGIELLLKIGIYLNNWLDACVAIERTLVVFYATAFNKKKSKTIAVLMSVILPILMSCVFIPQILNLRVYEDKLEERSWCVIIYSSSLHKYTWISILFHYFTPLLINFCSAVLIVIMTTRQLAATRTNRSLWDNFKSKIKDNRHLIISPIILIVLTAPHLLIALLLNCKKSSHLFWFYLIGYFLSFIPAASIFLIFIIPSTHYKREFKKLVAHIRRRFAQFKYNYFGS